MKNKILILLFITTTLFAQLIEPLPVEVTQQSQINYQIYQLQKEIDKQFNEDIKNGLEPDIIKIDKENIIIKDNKAIVNIEVYSNNSNKKRILEKQELVFTKGSTLTLEKSPLILEQTIERSKSEKINKNSISKSKTTALNRTTTTSEIEINLSDDVFVPYPIFEHTSDGDIYEIDFGLTEDTYDVQLFSAGAEVDGCVYYESYADENTYVRVAFYVDPDWKRIMYSREVNGEPGEIRGFWGDENVTFKKPVAIDVNEDGEIFVLDAEAKAVFKLQYNTSTNNITSLTSSVFIQSAHFKKPSDLCYSNGGSPGATNVHFIAITDLEDKSVMTFNYSGTLLNRYTEYDGIQINKPKRIVVMPYGTSLYKIVAFIDDNRIVRADVSNSTMNAFVSGNFPIGSNLTDIGVTAGDYGLPEALIVTDKSKNMLHYFENDGSYNCSYQGASQYFMIAPLRVFNTAFSHYDMSTKIKLDFYTMDMWSRVRGIKKFVPGADVIDISVTRGTFKWILHKYETNRQQTNIKLVDVETGNIISSGSSYAYDSDLVSGKTYKWVIEYKPFYDDYYVGYEIGWKTKEITFTHNPTMPTYIEGSYAISGAYTAPSTVTISNWGNLTLNSGTNITFQNGSALIVNGTLNVNGTSTNKVTFDFQYPQNVPANGIRNQIKINSSAIANITNAEIRNAYTGIYIDGGSANIDNCLIRNGYSGILLYGTNNNPSNDTYITNTRIYEQTVGIDFYNSTFVHLSHNQIDHNYIALSTYSSSPYLAPDDYNSESVGYNNIHTNSFGLMANYNSNPWLGRVSCTSFGGNNTIDGNTMKDVNLTNNCQVYAENNWWNFTPISYVGTGCFFDPYPFLYSAPSQSSAVKITSEEEEFNNKFNIQVTSSAKTTEKLSLVTSTNDKTGYDESWPIEWKLLYARNLMRVKKYNQAAKICESVITEFPDSARTYLALDLLWQSRKKEKSTHFSEFVKDKAKLKTNKQLFGVAELMLSATEKTNRLSALDGIENKYKDTPLVEHILFQKFMYYLYEENNIELAKTTADELGKLYPESESYYASQRHLGNDVVKPTEQLLAKEAVNEATTEIPQTYELLGNYPNPFNPSTTIKYALPYSSDVELTIYDITGKVITTLNRNGQSAGYQNIVWNGNNQQGSRVSSGVYFYRFKASSIDGSNKVFEKTAKMLMLK